MEFQSKHDIGEVAYFQPVISKIKWSSERQKYLIGESAIPVKIVGISFNGFKAMYDIALPNGDGSFYEVMPLMRVDSFFIHKADSVEEGDV